MAMETWREKVMVLCYWNCCIKYGPDGVYYEGGSETPKKILVKRKTEFKSLLDGVYSVTGLDKEKSKFEIFGRYPVAVSQHRFTYVHLPVVDDNSLETMLELPSNHPFINAVEFYLEVKSTSDDVIVRPSGSENLGRSSKRQKTDINSGLDVCLIKFGVSKPSPVSSCWLDGGDHELRVGLCFKDKNELKKAVDWFSIRGRRKCVVREKEKDMCTFECVRWKCNWSLCAARKEEHGGVFEIIKYTGPHTCDLEDFEAAFEADEIERVVRVHPTLSIPELNKWWKENIGYELETSKMRAAKLEAMERVFGDEDQSFRVIPKLMSAFHSSNGLLLDWQYDVFPNPEFASFRSMFWAFPQSIQGFQHCRPLIIVETRKLYGQYPLTLMIDSGVDAANKYFPLAFAVTKEVSVESWRWFLTRISEKVTQRKGICLISGYNKDVFDVVNEPESPWGYHSLKGLIEKAGSTGEKKVFDSYMKEIEKKNPEARRWLDQIPPHTWALAHDSGLRYGIMKIDRAALFAVCQSFSYYNLTVSGGVVLLFDELRDAFDESFNRSRESLNRGDVYTKPVMDKLGEFMTGSATYIITPLERDAFQVTMPKNNKEWIVRLNDSTCTCGEFQVYKFPCLHALAVCDKLKINPLQYVDECYTLERYYKTYSSKFNPVLEVSSWPEASGVPKLLFFPPPRPKTNVSATQDNTKEEIPSDEELRNAIVDILKVVDKTATVNGIFTRVAEKFEIDLSTRKPSIMVMILDEKRLADETEEDEEEEED